MKIDLSQFLQTFLHESADHVSTMESGLLTLRTDPGNLETLNAIFRSAHSIKGGAGSFGLVQLGHFTHALENLLDQMRSLEVVAEPTVVAVLLESIDVLRHLLESDASAPMPESASALIARLEAFTHGTAPSSPAAPAEAVEEVDESLHMVRVEFRPDHEIFAYGTNPLLLVRNLVELGQAAVTHLHDDHLPSLAELDTGQNYLGWTVEMATRASEAELREVFEFVENQAEIRIQQMMEPKAEPQKTIAETVALALHREQEPHPVEHAKKNRAPRANAADSGSIRVATDKVDRLIDLVGELVIAHVMTAQLVENFTPDLLPRLRESVAAMERNTRELHERVMAVRMLPIGTIFPRYQRIVYDVAQATGKQLNLVTSGEETEIDKSMLELLSDPLTHMIRNAADHGVESPEQRLAVGKPAEGTIGLRAFHRSGRVVMEVSDDGAGIDVERVRAKAIERGLILPGAQLSDDQIRMLIFEPGFSTRDQVSALSGRGVGMDVVKKNVQQLNGTISLASKLGHGSTITIELPLTLAILEGLLIGIGNRTLVLPLLSVIETVSPRPEQLARIAERGEVLTLRDESIPLVRLRRYLGLALEMDMNEPATRPLVVVVEAGQRKIGLVIDELLGQQQVVVKSLERHLRKVDGLMGATILGDGCVAPIIDVAGLAQLDLYSVCNHAA